MTPSSSLATRRSDLGGSMAAFDLAMNALGFIALSVFKVFESAMQAGTFGKIPLAFYLKNRETARAPGGAYARPTADEFTPATFGCIENGAEELIDDRTRAMYADFFDLEKLKAARGRHVVMQNLEKRMAAKLFNASTFTPTAVGTEWSNVASTPITDVEAAVKRFWERTGLWPNALVLNRRVFRNLRMNTQITDRIKAIMSVLPGDINTTHLQAAFDLPHILVAGGAKNSANEGQTVVPTEIWSNEYAGVARIAETGDLEEPCIGRTIHWGGDGSSIGTVFETYRDETRRSDVVRARMDTDELFMHDGCFELLSNITA